MTSQKTMDRMDVIMKNKECMNCGSTEFHQIENGWKCDYCGTLYLNQKKFVKEQPPSNFNRQKNLKVRILRSAAIPLLALFIGFFYFKANEKPAYKPTSAVTTQSNVTKKDFPAKWTQEIYDGVVVATKHYDADNEKYSFENGSSYEELEKLVGKPDTVTSWEKEKYGMPARATATWNRSKDGEYAENTVTITYNKNTLMITDKNYY